MSSDALASLAISSPSTDQLPTLPTPTYSPLPSQAEWQIGPSTAHAEPNPTQGTDEDWIFCTSHVQVNLGPRDVWERSMHIPIYGLGASVVGCVQIKGEHVCNVVATLKGDIITDILEDTGLITTHQQIPLLSHSITLYTSSPSDTSSPPPETEISIPIPRTVELNGHTVELPPSLSVFYPGISYEVTYALRIDMVRAGIRMHERLNIPIMYLPKSYPPTPPIYRIPRPTPAHPFPSDPRMRSVDLTVQWPKGSTQPNTQCSVVLTLPKSLCFTSGDTIPFLITLLSPSDPTLPGLIATKIFAHLVKRTTLHHGKSIGTLDLPLSVAELWEIVHNGEGVRLLRGSVKAGKVGEERSWAVKDVIDVEYIFQMSLQPPYHMSQYLPFVRHDETIQVATDVYGSQQRELLTMGGRPTPALGLLKLPVVALGRSATS